MSYYIAVGTSAGTISIRDTRDLNKQLISVNAHNGGINAMAITQDCSRLVTGGHDKRLRIWKLPNLDCDFNFNEGSKVWCIAITPDNLVVISGCDDGSIRLHTMATGRSSMINAHRAPVTDIACLSTRYIVTGGADGDITLWDLETSSAVKRIHLINRWINSLACIGQDYAAIASGQDNTISLWNLHNEQLRTTVKASASPWCIRRLQASTVVYGCTDGRIQSWDTTSDTTNTIGRLDSMVRSVNVSADGKILLASTFYQVALWDMETLAELNSWCMPGDQRITSAVVFKMTQDFNVSENSNATSCTSSDEQTTDATRAPDNEDDFTKLNSSISQVEVDQANHHGISSSKPCSATTETQNSPADVLIALPKLMHLLQLIQQSTKPNESTKLHYKSVNIDALQKRFELIAELQLRIRETAEAICSSKNITEDVMQALEDLISDRSHAIADLRSRLVQQLDDLRAANANAPDQSALISQLTDTLQSISEILPSVDQDPQNWHVDSLSKYLEDFFQLLNSSRHVCLDEFEFDHWLGLVAGLPIFASEVVSAAKRVVSRMSSESWPSTKSHAAYLEKHLQQMIRELDSIDNGASVGRNIAIQAADALKEILDVRRLMRTLEQNAEDGNISPEELIQQGTKLKLRYSNAYGKLASLRARLEKFLKVAPELYVELNNTRPPPTLDLVSTTCEPDVSAILDTDRSPMGYVQERVLSSSLNSSVYLMRLGEEQCVVKVITLDNKQQLDNFLSEVAIMRKLRHPLILPLRAAFIDNSNPATPLGYIETEYVESGTLDQWLENARAHGGLSDWQLQSMFNSIALAVNFLHNNSIIHRDLKLQNILVKRDGTPVLIDFGVSRDLSAESRSSMLTTYKGFTPGYEPPEVAEGHRWTKAGDVYSFGIMMFRAFFPDVEPVLLPDKPYVEIPSHHNHHLRALLKNILQRNPKNRPSMEFILSSAFMTRPLVNNSIELRSIKKTEEILDVFTQLVENLPRKKTSISLLISKRNLVSDVINAFSTFTTEMLLENLNVKFIEEPVASDLGGLLSEMYTLFFASPHESFPNVFHPKYKLMQANDTYTLFLPSSDAPPETFEVIGTIMLKAIIDKRPVPLLFAPIVYKYLCDSDMINPSNVNLLPDLEIWDKSLAAGYHKMLLTSLETQGLVGELDFDGLMPNGKNIKVTDNNKYDWVQLKIYDLLVGKRKPQLEALRKGLHRISNLNSGFKLLSSFELELVLTGKPTLTPQLIISSLNFEDFPLTSSTPNHLMQYLRQLSPTGLHKFLQYATGLLTIPYTSTFVITIRRADNTNMLPVAHTCSRWIHLPDYNDFEVLKQKMNMIFSTGAHIGFGIV